MAIEHGMGLNITSCTSDKLVDLKYEHIVFYFLHVAICSKVGDLAIIETSPPATLPFCPKRYKNY